MQEARGEEGCFDVTYVYREKGLWLVQCVHIHYGEGGGGRWWVNVDTHRYYTIGAYAE